MSERCFPAELEQLEPVQQFVGKELERVPCESRAKFQLEVAVEEIFVNIAHYAYGPEQKGTAVVRCWVEENPPTAVVQFADRGVPFDPLRKRDADTTLPAEKRQIGGLGIYMVKKSMDAVEYAHVNGENILTIRKTLQSQHGVKPLER